jgi:hypothetical protein
VLREGFCLVLEAVIHKGNLCLLSGAGGEKSKAGWANGEARAGKIWNFAGKTSISTGKVGEGAYCHKPFSLLHLPFIGFGAVL